MRISDWSSDVCSSDLPQDGGTKLYGVSGKVNTPGAWELPMGVTLRELIEEHGGGLKKGLRFRGALPGGASTDFLVERSEEHTSELQSLMRISYAVFCLKKKKNHKLEHYMRTVICIYTYLNT